MSSIVEGIMGWLTIMGMVFGGVGVLFFILSLLRSILLLSPSHKRESSTKDIISITLKAK